MKDWRSRLVFIFFLIFGAVLLNRLFYIQVLKGDLYKALVLGQYINFEDDVEKRGRVFFNDGKTLLATNFISDFVFVSPSNIKDKEKVSKILATLLNIEEEEILKKLKNDSFYQEIKSDLSKEEVEKLKDLNLKGVYLSQRVKRYYPQEELASKVIGFLDKNGKGQYGIEYYFDEQLKKGNDLILTLDFNVQFKAEKLLELAKENLNIEGGQIIILEPARGKLLALADFPNFNPNQYFKYENFEIFQNQATQKLFEPGSIFKPITIAVGLNEGKITPNTTYYDSGVVQIGGRTIYNFEFRSWGKQTMTNVLERSINTGAVFVKNLIPHETFLKYIENFGIFRPSGLELPEIYSENKNLKKGYEINFATASFGQGIEMTPIQIVKAIATIANGGKSVKPCILEKIFKNEEIIFKPDPEISFEEIISPQTVSQLTAMMVSVVENGYGKRAKIPGYYIAGKTGTSQIPFSSLGIKKAGYSEKTWQTFIGWLPAFAPKFLILVKLDNPQTKMSGLSTTLIAKELLKYLIDYYQIPPDY